MDTYRSRCCAAVAAAVLLGACAADDDAAAAAEADGSGDGGSTDAGPADTTAGPTTSATTSDGTTGGETGTDATGDTTGDPPVVCPAEILEPGDYENIDIDVDGTLRRYNLHVPPSYDGTSATPLVLNLHGFTSNPGQQAMFSDFNPAADAAGYIVAYPAGIGSSWNAGICCGQAALTGVDDLGFIRALVGQLEEDVCVDPRRIFATGMSNGGFLSHRLACEASDIFAAIAPVAGVVGIPEEDCQPERPVPVLHFHGTADPLVPYGGGGFIGSMSAPESTAAWVALNGCTDADPAITFQQGDVTCETWSQCDEDAEVSLCTIEGAGHCWPGQPLCPFGISTSDIEASPEITAFFDRFPMP